MTQLFGGKSYLQENLNVHKFVSGILTSHRLTAPCRFGRDGGGPPDADDLAGSERGWGVPVQPVREAVHLKELWRESGQLQRTAEETGDAAAERSECDEGFRGMQHTEEVLWPAALSAEPSAHGNWPGGCSTRLMD